MPPRWHVLTGEYPPQTGGVADYTASLVAALRGRGEHVEVWAPEVPGAREEFPETHRLPGGFGVRGLASLARSLTKQPGRNRLLIQYVPQSLGFRGLNLPFALWLSQLPRSLEVWTFFHEVAFPFSRGAPVRHQLLAGGTRLMAALVVRRSDVLLASTEAWCAPLRQVGAGAREICVLPVPSNLPTAVEAGAVPERRRSAAGGSPLVLGHFGTYGEHIKALLFPALERILLNHPTVQVVLLGRGASTAAAEAVLRFPALAGRLSPFEDRDAQACAEMISACDLLLQPFSDGVTTRRTSLMAALALGRPVVTNNGPLTERVWSESRAVALADGPQPALLAGLASELLDAPEDRARLAERGLQAYERLFSLEQTVLRLQRLAEPPVHRS